MTFTDEDLKRLKEQCKQNGTAFEVDDYLLEALLARLEAGEKALEGFITEYDDADLSEINNVGAWRKVCGK